MLEVEERKMKKKIDDTSKRAEKIMKIKQENEDRFIEKMNRQNEVSEKLLRFKDNNKL